MHTEMHGLLDVFVGIIPGITGLVLQRMVMPEVERWVTNSSRSGTSLCSAKRLTHMLTFLRNSFDWDASLPLPCQPTSVACWPLSLL